uniref:15-oxoprostaglandin 13-reductase n=1 Tax=Lygus hesperus TaxID=30085 RepID=A0A0A9WDC0_LYGHE
MSKPELSAFHKLSVTKLTKDFRDGTAVVPASLPDTVPEGQVYVRVLYVGVNATDINVTNGAYNKAAPPFDCGLEALGVVEKVASDVTHISVNDHVLCIVFNAYAEYISVSHTACIKLPDDSPKYLVLAVSGLTAAIALGELGNPCRGDVALVTAAAGGTGQIAVQLLKHVYQCTVIGTCSSDDKADFLHSIGCDHTINYKTDDLNEKLTHYAPRGLNVIYECIGGETYNTALNHIAVGGRLVIIGSISTYKSGKEVAFNTPSGSSLQSHLIFRSASLRGFLLIHYRNKFVEYTKKLLEYTKENKLQLNVDKTATFFGLNSIADALDHLYSGKSFGKVVVKIQEQTS